MPRCGPRHILGCAGNSATEFGIHKNPFGGGRHRQVLQKVDDRCTRVSGFSFLIKSAIKLLRPASTSLTQLRKAFRLGASCTLLSGKWKQRFTMNEDDQRSQTDVAPLDGAVHETDVQLLRKERANLAQVKQWFLGTLSRKNLMALTGLFLCFFLVIHLFGNLQLLLPAEVAHWQFNFCSKLLSENIFIELISYVLFASILAHALYALFITIKNRRANGKRYEYDRRGVSSKWYSRTMGLLGTIILVFLVIHLRDFWYRFKFGHVPLDKDGQKDLHTLVVTVYHNGSLSGRMPPRDLGADIARMNWEYNRALLS
jgi:succinate dehydrogenase/fumarate reductase cytochrome b subunit (b558 family)